MTNLTIAEQWNLVGKIKVFEVEVLDKRTNENDFIIFGISIGKNKFRAEHVAFNEVEEQSKFIAFCETDIDTDFSLDENLQTLYSECIDAICCSDFYELID